MNPFAIPAFVSAAYSGACLLACARALRKTPRQAARSGPLEGISILKPLHGRDPHLYDALRSHAEQDYPEFEIVFGVCDPADAAIEDIERLRAAYPAIPISLHVIQTSAPNAKAGVLAGLAKRARHAVLVVNDGDIKVPHDYLREVAAPLSDPKTGLVTCLYRATADSWAARSEALGIATEFAPSVLVARLVGVGEFALGATMALRAGTLAETGGFESIADYLADDYQLGRRIHAHGYRIHFANLVVETALGAQSWAQVWRHQVRWSRTIRVSRPSGYYGYIVTQAALWSIVAFAAGAWQAGAIALGLRVVAGVCAARWTLQDRSALRLFWLIPLRDLFGFAVWIAGLFGNRVVWRDQPLRLMRDGRVIRRA